MIKRISHTTTIEGLTITNVKDSEIYPISLKITDEDLTALDLFRETFHSKCNYTIKPQAQQAIYFRVPPKFL